MNHLLETYVTDDAIPKTEMEIQNFELSSKIMWKDYEEVLRTTALRCNQEYNEYTLKGITIEGLLDSILNSM